MFELVLGLDILGPLFSDFGFERVLGQVPSREVVLASICDEFSSKGRNLDILMSQASVFFD